MHKNLKTCLILSLFIPTLNAFGYNGNYVSVALNPSGQRLSTAFGSSQDIVGGGGEIEFGKRTGGFEVSGLIGISAGEAKSFTKRLEDNDYRFGANTQSFTLGSRLKYRLDNFYFFVTPQLKAISIEDNGASEPEDDVTPVSGQIYDYEEVFVGYGSDIGLGFNQNLNNGFVEDVFYQLSYSINNYSKNYGEYKNGEEKRKINRSVGSQYYDQSVMLTVGFTFGDSIVDRGKEAYSAIKSKF